MIRIACKMTDLNYGNIGRTAALIWNAYLFASKNPDVWAANCPKLEDAMMATDLAFYFDEVVGQKKPQPHPKDVV